MSERLQWGGDALHHPLDHVQLQAIADEGRTTPPVRWSWMAVEDGELAGHIELALHRESRSGRLGRVAIAPELRGRGLGPQLVALAVNAAWDVDWIERVDLRVYTWNAPALATYRRLGFVTERVGRQEREVDGERWEVATMLLERAAREPPSGVALCRLSGDCHERVKTAGSGTVGSGRCPQTGGMADDLETSGHRRAHRSGVS